MRGLLAALLATLALCLAAPAHAAFTVTNIGLSCNNGADATCVETTTVDAPVGSLVVVYVGVTDLGTTPAVSDNASTPNTYTDYKTCNSGGGANIGQLWYSVITTDLPIGGQISITHLVYGSARGYVITGAATASVTDGGSCSVIASPTTTFAAGSVTPGTSGDLVMGFAFEKFGAAFTQDAAGYGTPPTFVGTCSSSCNAIGGSLTNSGTSAVNYSPTTSSNTNGGIAAMALFKPSGGVPSAPPYGSKMGLTGAGM